MTIQQDLARSELRAVLDELGDELRRGRAASAGRVRMQTRRARALYASAELNLLTLVEVLQRVEDAAREPDQWDEFAGSAPVVAERLKGFARGVMVSLRAPHSGEERGIDSASPGASEDQG